MRSKVTPRKIESGIETEAGVELEDVGLEVIA